MFTLYNNKVFRCGKLVKEDGYVDLFLAGHLACPELSGARVCDLDDGILVYEEKSRKGYGDGYSPSGTMAEVRQKADGVMAIKILRFAGIDPGLYGARVVIDQQARFIGMSDVPLASKFHQVDPASRFDLVAWTRGMRSPDMRSDFTMIESPTHFGYGGHSGWWTVSLLTFTYGMWVGLCSAGNRKGGLVQTVSPRTWKAAMVSETWLRRYIAGTKNRTIKRLIGIKRKRAEFGKRLAIARAMDLCVDPEFRKIIANSSPFERQHGRAEAFLLALYCRRLHDQGKLLK